MGRAAGTNGLTTKKARGTSLLGCARGARHCDALSRTFEHFLFEGGNLLPNGKGLCLISEAVLCQTGETEFCRQNEADYATTPPYGKSRGWMNENFASALGCTDVRILRGHY